MSEQVVPASSPVTADDVRAALARARQEAVVKASEAGAWAPPIAALLADGLADIPNLTVAVEMPGTVRIHRVLSPWCGDRTRRQVEIAYESPGHVLIVVGGSGDDDDDPVLFEDVVTEREALGMIANWAIQP